MMASASMLALWLNNQGTKDDLSAVGGLWLRRDLPIPSPEAGEALVKVRLAGICATDLEMVRGYYPFSGILGHEFVGEVIQAPEGEDWVGQRVVGEINLTCGQCKNCLEERASHCERRTTLGIWERNGVFAEYLTLPIKNLHRVAESIPDEMAVFTEPLAAALEIQQQIAIHPADQVLLVGAGRLGQLIAQSLALTGCNLSVVVRHELHQQILAKIGISTIIEEEVGQKYWDIVVEATGAASGFNLASQAVRPCGTIVLKSTFAGKSEINLSTLVVDEIHLIGSRCGPFPSAMHLLESGSVQTSMLISARYPLTDALVAFKHAMQPGTLKILLDPTKV
jgi:threonine dehydrogenase-like Zn-dependent dehydrogenase